MSAPSTTNESGDVRPDTSSSAPTGSSRGDEGVVMVNTEGVARTRHAKNPAAQAKEGQVQQVEEGQVQEAEFNEARDKTQLDPLFPTALAGEFRKRWDEIQRGFVDDPQQAVKAGDKLVTQVIESLAESFRTQHQQSHADSDAGTSTEKLRLALRRYRAFFERLLAA